ncbi:MAG: flavodoxin family protein, partial [Promethearchaeota archaeon]
MKIKFIIFYFSGTGNTWWVTKEFANIIEEKGNQVEIYSIENEKCDDVNFLKEKIREVDALGIAYPIYGSTAPKIMWTFIEKLKEASEVIEEGISQRNEEKTRISFVITTMALFSGDGALVTRKELETIGFKLIGAINLKMSSNISIPYFPYNPVEKEKLEKRKKKAIEDLEDFYSDLIKEKKHLEGRWNLLGKFGGWMQRVGMDWVL